MLIKKCRKLLKIGQKVSTNGNGILTNTNFINGIVSEITETDFYVANNTNVGSTPPMRVDETHNEYIERTVSKYGMLYNWIVSFQSNGEIEIKGLMNYPLTLKWEKRSTKIK